MGEVASTGQLRMAFVRRALLTIPLIVFFGFLSGRLANAGNENRWYAMLDKPAAMPPGIAFPIAWSLFYILMGLAVAVVLHARGAKGRGIALGLFVAQFVLNLAWSPVFFGMHKVSVALVIIIAMLGTAIATTIAFGRIRPIAAWLMVPYLAWLGFAGSLNFDIVRLNPDAETLAPAPPSAQIRLDP